MSRNRRTRDSMLLDSSAAETAEDFLGPVESREEKEGQDAEPRRFEETVHVPTEEEREREREKEIERARERRREGREIPEREDAPDGEAARQRKKVEERKQKADRAMAEAEDARKRTESARKKAEEAQRAAEEAQRAFENAEREAREAMDDQKRAAELAENEKTTYEREASDYDRWKKEAERRREEERQKRESEERRLFEEPPGKGNRMADLFDRGAMLPEDGIGNGTDFRNVSRVLEKTPFGQSAAEGEFPEKENSGPGRRYRTPFESMREEPSRPSEPHRPRETPPVSYTGYEEKPLEKPEDVPKSYRQKIISIYSPKGGVGKTSFSQAAACGFSHKDAKIDGRNLKVLLVDFDWEFPDVHSSFYVESNPNFYRLVDIMRQDLKQRGKLQPYYDRRLIEQCVIHINERLDILAGSENPAEWNKLNPQIVKTLMNSLRTLDYDVIVIDNANSARNITFQVLEDSDLVLLLATLDFSTIDEIQRFLNTAWERQFDVKKMKLVINGVPEKLGNDIPAPSEVVNHYKLEHLADIPEDESVREYNNAALPYMWSGKNTEYTRAVRAMINKIVPVFPEKKKGIFARLLGK